MAKKQSNIQPNYTQAEVDALITKALVAKHTFAGGTPDSVGLWQIGAIYLIRTVTMTDVGRLMAITDRELLLEDAAWIANTGRFADALKSESFDEVEPFPEGHVIINRSAIIDAVTLSKLQRVQK